MKLALAAAAITAVGILAFASASPGPDRAGYFKSSNGNRVFVIEVDQDPDRDEARRIFEALPATPGRAALAVLYVGEAPPSENVTLAPNFAAAASILASPPHGAWAWRWIVNARGEATLEAL